MERALREPDEAMYATVVYRITWTSAARTEVDPPFQDLRVVHREDVRVEWSDAPKDRDLGRGHEVAGFAIFDWVEVGHSILLEELIEHFLGPDAHVAFATERGKDKPLRPSGLSHVTSKPHEDPVTPPRTAE